MGRLPGIATASSSAPRRQPAATLARTIWRREIRMATGYHGRGESGGREPGTRLALPATIYGFVFTAKSHTCMLSLVSVYSTTAYSPGSRGVLGQIL